MNESISFDFNFYNFFGGNKMFSAELAGIKINFDNKYYYINGIMKPWISEFEKPDFTVKVSDEEIEKEKLKDKYNNFHTASYYESICMYRNISNYLPYYNAFIFHAAVFDISGLGIALTAQSGVGKTTHMLLWQKLFPNKLKIINGDKPIVRIINNTPFAYGTPWNGKENLGCNSCTKLKHICIIKRNENNFIKLIDSKDAVKYLMNQVYLPKTSKALSLTIQLLNDILNSCIFWEINCNENIESAKIASSEILK